MAPNITMEEEDGEDIDFQLPLSKCNPNHFYSQSIHIFYPKLKDDGERKQVFEIYGRHLYFYYNREVQDTAKQFKPTLEENNFISCAIRENRVHLKQMQVTWWCQKVRNLFFHCSLYLPLQM